MRATRRRTRASSPLYTPDAVRSILIQLREQCAERIPKTDRQLLLMLEAVRNIERRPATDTKQGRPSHWRREDLLEVARHLRAVLERETSGKVSLQSFIAQYLKVLRFPSEVQSALNNGEINFEEAAHLARLTAERLGCSLSEARSRRVELLKSHLMARASQNTLRTRVKELLGESQPPTSNADGVMAAIQRVDELLEIDPSDTRHIFWEEMKRLLFALREIQPEDLDDQILDDFTAAMDDVSNVLYKIELRRRKREEQPQKMRI
jgi:hypothetical protein